MFRKSCTTFINSEFKHGFSHRSACSSGQYEYTYRCVCHDDCLHRFKIRPLQSGEGFQLLRSGFHNNILKIFSRGVHPTLRETVKVMTNMRVKPLTMMNKLKEKNDIMILPSKKQLYNFKKKLKRSNNEALVETVHTTIHIYIWYLDECSFNI
jgi:hypothetical protein